MKKILIINWLDAIGGCETISNQLAGLFNTRVIDINTALKALGIQLRNQFYTPYSAVERSVIITRFLYWYEQLFKPDLIIDNDFCTVTGSFKTPIISIAQNPYADIATELFYKGMYGNDNLNEFGYAYTFLQKQQFSKSKKIVAVSNYMKNYVKKYGFESEVIEHGVNLDKFRQMDKVKLRKKYGLPDKIIAISPTKFHPVKGFHILSELVRANQDIHWLIITPDKITRNPRHSNVTMLSGIKHCDIPELYNCADVYVLPTVCESFNLTAIEALACNIPIITQQAGVFNDVVSGAVGETGIMTDYGLIATQWDVKTYQEALDFWKANKDKFRPRKTAEERFDINRWKKQWSELISQI